MHTKPQSTVYLRTLCSAYYFYSTLSYFKCLHNIFSQAVFLFLICCPLITSALVPVFQDQEILVYLRGNPPTLDLRHSFSACCMVSFSKLSAASTLLFQEGVPSQCQPCQQICQHHWPLMTIITTQVPGKLFTFLCLSKFSTVLQNSSILCYLRRISRLLSL